MSDSTPVNSQITDAVTEVNIKVLGDAPAVAMGNLFQTVNQAIQNAAHNATGNQPPTGITVQVTTTEAIDVLNDLGQATGPRVATPAPGAPS